jgi:predicted RNA-binding Zn-ribbon protein involved in translation (DUF1610 family)
MKCYACGFDDNRDGEFHKVFVVIPKTDYDTEIHVQCEEESVEETVYACPKCGTLKIESDEEIRE